MDDADGADGAPRRKLDDDDHDLLTFGEVGERLRVEIAALEAEAKQLLTRGAGVDELRKRIDALRSAAARNSAQPINEANFESFFGYPGTAKRSTHDSDDASGPR